MKVNWEFLYRPWFSEETVGPQCLAVLFSVIAAVILFAGFAHGQQQAAAGTGAPKYAGSEECKVCHEDIYKSFEKSPHWKTLLDKKGGSSKQGCEACHGTGQEHIEGGGDKTKIFSFKTAQRTISTLATAGDILFAGQSDGLFVALDAETGERLWRFQCGAGVNAPPVTYEVDGRQYVAVAAGGNSKEGDLTGLAGERFFQNGGTIFVFTLPGLKSR